MGCSFRRRSLSAHAISVMTKGIDDKSRDYAEAMILSEKIIPKKIICYLQFFA